MSNLSEAVLVSPSMKLYMTVCWFKTRRLKHKRPDETLTLWRSEPDL